MPPKLRLDEEQRRVLRALRSHGPASRSALAAQLELSAATLTKLARDLLAQGLIEEIDGEEAQGRGRPAVPLRISAHGGYAVGATAHKGVLEVALVDYAGGVIAIAREQYESLSPQEFARRIRRQMHALADRHNLLGRRLLGVGLGVPGPVLSPDGDRWSVVDSLPGWRDVPLRQVMDDVFGLPVWIENDANAAALAEYYLGGLMQRCATAAAILLGHGIGAGVIVEGRVLTGQMGNAGDVGALYPSDRPRPSTNDLMRELRAAGCDIRSVADFETRTAGYEAVVEQWVARAAGQLELLVNTGFVWLDPGAIILCGPLPHGLLTRLAERLNAADLVRGPGGLYGPKVGVSRLGGSSTTLGAALLPIHATAQG